MSKHSTASAVFLGRKCPGKKFFEKNQRKKSNIKIVFFNKRRELPAKNKVIFLINGIDLRFFKQKHPCVLKEAVQQNRFFVLCTCRRHPHFCIVNDLKGTTKQSGINKSPTIQIDFS